MLKNSPVTSQDVDVALKIWGTSVVLLKGKTLQKKTSICYGRRNRGAKGNPVVTQGSDFDH
jgi:hypothetical protein